jgi:hypothetical protein
VDRAGAAGGGRKDPVAAAAAGLRGFEREGGKTGRLRDAAGRGAPGDAAPHAADAGGSSAGGVDDAMLLLKEKTEEMVRERVALRREQEEFRGNNERLFGELEQSKAAEVPAAAKHRDLEARLVMANAGRAVARGALEEGSPGW